jgi:hypothetical protein
MVSAAAHSAPGWGVTGLTVAPGNAGKVVAAFDELFDSRVGGKMPGRVSLRVNVADGANPETHTVLVLTKSAAEREAYEAELYASDAWADFLETMSELNRAPGTTMRGVIIWNAGELSDGDVVWVNHYLTVEEPGVLLNALKTYLETESGQGAPGQVHLSAVVAGGPGQPSHILSIGYESEAEWEAWQDKAQSDPARQALLNTIGAISQYHGANIQREAKAWGSASVEDVTSVGD